MRGAKGVRRAMVLGMRRAMVADIYWTIFSRFTFGGLARGLRRALGEARYVRWRKLFFHRLLRRMDPTAASALIKEYKGFHLLQHNGIIFGLPQDLGAVDPRDDPHPIHPALVTSRSAREGQQPIHRHAPA